MKANRLEILNKLFGDVFVPNAVFHELTDNERFTEEAALIRDSNFIKIVNVNNEEAVSLLQKNCRTGSRRK